MWALGKVVQEWYMVKWVWDDKYAEHLKKLGYQVEKRNPTIHVC